MNSVYVRHSKEVNEKKGIRDFYLFDDRGELVIDGSMRLDEAFDNIKTKIAIRDSCNTSLWLPTTGPPKLQCSIQQTFKKAEKLKSCATSCMKWLLSVQQFPGWICPVKKDKFVLDEGQLSKFKTVNISMEDIIAWKSLSLLKNGFVSGNFGMITPS